MGVVGRPGYVYCKVCKETEELTIINDDAWMQRLDEPKYKCRRDCGEDVSWENGICGGCVQTMRIPEKVKPNYPRHICPTCRKEKSPTRSHCNTCQRSWARKTAAQISNHPRKTAAQLANQARALQRARRSSGRNPRVLADLMQEIEE